MRYLLAVLLILVLLPGMALAQDAGTTHIVQPGDNLYRISLQYGVSVADIAQANNISNTDRILVGQRLIIPDMSGAVENALVAAEPTYHIVQPGETLASIANRYGITVDQLVQINNIANPNRIERGQTLTVFELNTEPVAPAAPVEAPVTTYVVQPGEQLAEIAQRFGVTWPDLVAANNIVDPNRIVAGQTITIPGARITVEPASASSDLGILAPTFTAPPATVMVGKEIIVDLSDSRIYAYENGQLVRSVLASMGRAATPTIKGNFTVQRKYNSQLMSGPGYYLPNVQWIMYFYGGYAIHGAYWHNNFGQPMSHGCVNLPNEEALWFYEFAPVGTPVRVQA
jgi:LysM repeat protein